MTNKKFYWFGDSWVFGDELEKEVPDPNNYTFAQLVSNHFGATNVNLSSNGSSIDNIPIEFSKIASNINPEIDCVFFFLTAAHRVSMFDDTGNLKNILPSNYKEAHKVHDYSDQWYKYFDTPLQRTYNYDKTINLLYLWCQHIGVKCYFSNIFTTELSLIIDCTPESAWLLPKNTCIAEYILPVIDTTDYRLITEDHPDLTNDQWNAQEPYVKKYIRPCFQHPNVAGHQEIATQLIKLLHE
jgi:hypothetical protein